MKLLNFLIIGLTLSVLSGKSQECKVYIPGTIGTEIELTTYDKKDKPTQINKQTLKDIKISGDTTIYLINQVVTDEKGKEPMESNYRFKCLGAEFFVDMNTFFDQKTLDAYKGMQMKITTSDINFPSNMAAGQKLKDGFIKLEVMAGPIPVTMKIDIVNRTVEGFENITTPAGTFACVKITQDIKGDFGFVKSNLHSVGWYSEKIGTVRSETYNQGKLNSYMVLTALRK